MKAQKQLTKGLYQMSGSKYWWYRWQDNGRRFAVSLKTENLEDAIKAKQAILDDVERHGSEPYRPLKGHGDSGVEPVLDIIDHYLEQAQSRTRKAMRIWTAKNVKVTLKAFCRESGVADGNPVTTQKMAAWIKAKKGGGSAA